MSSFFDAVEMAPRDPILGLNEQYLADPNPAKVNLGVGVYFDENGKLPLLKCVRAAEAAMAEAPKPRGYLPIDGIAAYDLATQTLVFGADNPARKSGRVATVQAVGGTGGLKVGADLLKRMSPGAKVLISDPSWENHRALFEGAGFDVGSYPYYDSSRHDVDFAAMRAGLEAAAPGTIVVLHACCHNPTGCDLTPAQWAEVVAVLVEVAFDRLHSGTLKLSTQCWVGVWGVEMSVDEVSSLGARWNVLGEGSLMHFREGVV